MFDRKNTPPFYKNPLECLVTNKENGYITVGSEMERLIGRISLGIENVLVRDFPDNQKLVYCYTFNCFTAMPFYAALLKELSEYTNQVDKCPSPNREIIWEQFFTMVGYQENKFSGFFAPYLEGTMRSPKIKVSDIEILFLSFFLILKYIPDIFTSNFLPNYVPEDREILRNTLRRNAQTFFSSLRESMILVGSQKMKLVTSEWQNNHLLISEEQKNNTVSSFISDLSLDMLSSVHILLLIEHWAPKLNTLPREKKVAIWEACGKISMFDGFVEGFYNMEHYINNWGLNMEESKQEMSTLYKSIVKLHKLNILDDESFSPIYISDKLREIMNNKPPSPTKLNYLEKDNLSNNKRAFSAPSYNFNDTNNNNLNTNNNTMEEPTDFLGRSFSQQSTIKIPNPKDKKFSFTLVNKEFEKMVIREEPEEQEVENTKECEMKDVEDTNYEDQKTTNKIDISNLIC